MLPPLEVVARFRPFDLLSTTAVTEEAPGTSSLTALPRPAPFATVLADLDHVAFGDSRVALGLIAAGVELAGWWDPDSGGVGLDVTDSDGRTSTHSSRRHGRVSWRPTSLALCLTGRHVTLLCHEDEQWVARARYDLADRVETRDEGWLARLEAWHRSRDRRVRRLRAGGFGELGLRDLRLVTHADGTPLRRDGTWWLSATSAGPGFFDTAHASLWRLDDDLRVSHASDLYFRRPDQPGVYGDHALHVVRDGDRWLVATSTWGDFDRETNPSVRVTLAEVGSDDAHGDLLHGEHVLDTRELPLPTNGFRSVGVWDPHLLRDGDGWLVGYASARKFFTFHPCVAGGPSLDRLTLRASATDRRATEGITLQRLDGRVRVLASDGRDGRRGQRARFPVLDLDLAEVGTLDAPYPTNLPWPTVLETDRGWAMVTFNGARRGGPLLDYGTHGDVVVMREAAAPPR